VRKIAAIMLEETKARVATKGIELAVGPRLLERIIQDGYSLEYGVRPLRQVGACRLGAPTCCAAAASL
jgi:ATP-dependent Clp protease ATP-binding subunit ClpA